MILFANTPVPRYSATNNVNRVSRNIQLLLRLADWLTDSPTRRGRLSAVQYFLAAPGLIMLYCTLHDGSTHEIIAPGGTCADAFEV